MTGQLFYWVSSICFGEFEVTDDINSLVLWVDGSSGLVLLPGLLGCAICLGGWISYFALVGWVRRQQAKPFYEEGQRLDLIEKQWKEQRRKLAQELVDSSACEENWQALEDFHREALEMVLTSQPPLETE